MDVNGRIALVRNSRRVALYQSLSDEYAAIEPPVWMMLREQMLKAEGKHVFIIDNEVENLSTYGIIEKLQHLKISKVEIYPTGNHPSAYIQQRDGVENFAAHVKQVIPDVQIKYKLDFRPTDVEADWNSFKMNRYKAHNWHCDWGNKQRSPYGVIFTSIGCPFSCKFCCIKDFYGETYVERDLEMVIDEIDILVEQNDIKNFKMMDELFFYRKERVEKFCDMLIERDYGLNIWAYARIDTVQDFLLEKMRKAGIRWLGIGIESGNEAIRKSSMKGSFSNKKIKEVLQNINDYGIYVGANFIFGFPEDTMKTMQETLDFAKDLKCEFNNLYTMMAYPGSELYNMAVEKGWKLPETWSAYSQYSYDCHPIRTNTLESAQVLKFRDEAFLSLYTESSYLSYIEKTFGRKAVESINAMTDVKLKRKLLETI